MKFDSCRRGSRRRSRLVVRTYRRIAEILSERGGTAMSPALVARICREAEMKILYALRADPLIDGQVHAVAAHRRDATHPKESCIGKTWGQRPRWSQS